MWLKIFNKIAQYIPQNDKFHDVQIFNDCIYIDGKLKHQEKTDFFSEIKVFDRDLTKKEIQLLAANQSLDADTKSSDGCNK